MDNERVKLIDLAQEIKELIFGYLPLAMVESIVDRNKDIEISKILRAQLFEQEQYKYRTYISFFKVKSSNYFVYIYKTFSKRLFLYQMARSWIPPHHPTMTSIYCSEHDEYWINQNRKEKETYGAIIEQHINELTSRKIIQNGYTFDLLKPFERDKDNSIYISHEYIIEKYILHGLHNGYIEYENARKCLYITNKLFDELCTKESRGSYIQKETFKYSRQMDPVFDTLDVDKLNHPP